MSVADGNEEDPMGIEIHHLKQAPSSRVSEEYGL